MLKFVKNLLSPLRKTSQQHCRRKKKERGIMDYGVIADLDCFNGEYTKNRNTELWDLIDNSKWSEVAQGFETNKYSPWEMRMMSKQERLDGKVQDLNTPLHKAVEAKVEAKIVKKLLEAGASTALKNNLNQTPYDVAVKLGSYDQSILDLLRPPAIVFDNSEAMEAMEKKLQELVVDISCGLIEEHGVVLPQVGFIFEKNARIHYLIPGMYGGFNFEVSDEDELDLEVFSFCRIVGGSERKHIIHKDASVTEIKIPYP
eukprot:TRINITY_DN2956_c0_g1_i4.p1 TRINITY_DN2956_c0_g1~~TRINITY_DN2956_c0_g1_i4.p1  ORF type:complete len:258 (-),score=47.55 TRINITY_DN2956_c0_g1_i4:449-1222(-)